MTTSFGANITSSGSGVGAGVSGAAKAGAHGSVGGAVAGVVGAASSVLGVESAIASLIPAMILCVERPEQAGVVPFDFNPKEIVFTRTAPTMARPQAGTPGSDTAGSGGPITPQSDTVQIKLTEVYLDGMTTKLRCDTLLRWMGPAMDALGEIRNVSGDALQSTPPPLRFVWGPPKIGFFYKCQLQQCTISYERFSPMGIPVRAKLSLTLKQLPDLLADLPTNPTSGGPAGRRSHTMHAGDSLQSLAQTYYGNPNAWRMIAAANRIDDPARVRPGTRVYLPIGPADTHGTGL